MTPYSLIVKIEGISLKQVYLIGKPRGTSLKQMMLHTLEVLHENRLCREDFPAVFCRFYRDFEIIPPRFSVDKADYVIDLDGILIYKPMVDE